MTQCAWYTQVNPTGNADVALATHGSVVKRHMQLPCIGQLSAWLIHIEEHIDWKVLIHITSRHTSFWIEALYIMLCCSTSGSKQRTCSITGQLHRLMVSSWVRSIRAWRWSGGWRREVVRGCSPGGEGLLSWWRGGCSAGGDCDGGGLSITNGLDTHQLEWPLKKWNKWSRMRACITPNKSY